MLTKIKNNKIDLIVISLITVIAVSFSGFTVSTTAYAKEQHDSNIVNKILKESACLDLEVNDIMLSEEELAAIEAEKQRKIEEENARKAAEEAARIAVEEEAARLARLEKLVLTETSQGSMEENAKKIFSVLSAAGIPNINIAAVLGNWQVESGIDPTSIEGVYNEPYFIGSAKSNAIADPASQAMRCFQSYANSGLNVNQNAYYRANGELWPGIGLGGFTGGSIDPLINWSNKIGKPWYSLETQISYAIKGYQRAGWLASWTTPEQSIEAATRSFLINWEGCNVGISQRAANAYNWLDKINTWNPDLSYGNMVLSIG